MTGPPPAHGVCDGVWGPHVACWAEGGEPLPPGPFAPGAVCSLQDAANHTYACVRTLNATDDTLYCELADGARTVEYYDLAHDPWQMHNAAAALPAPKRAALAAQLAKLASSAGAVEDEVDS